MRRGGAPLDWRSIFDAFESRDDDRIAAVCDRRVRWHTLWPGMDPVFHGRAGVKRWRQSIDEALSGLSLDVEEAIELDRNRVFLAYWVRAHGRESGVAAHMLIYDLWTLRRGRLLRRTTHHTRDEALTVAGVAENAGMPAALTARVPSAAAA